MDVELPNGRIIKDVPEGTPRDVIRRRAIASGLATEADFQQQTQRSQPTQEMGPVPPQPDDPENLFSRGVGALADISSGISGQINRSLAGVGETALTVGTGALAEPIAGYAGIAAGLAPGGRTGPEAIEQTREALTYQPRTQAGQQALSELGTALSPITGAMEYTSDVLGEAGYKVGGPVGGTIGATIPVAVAEILGIKGTRAAKTQALRQQVEQSGVENVLTPEVRAALSRQGFTEQDIATITEADPAAMERLARFQRLGIQPTRGDVTQRLEQQKPERMLEQTAQDESGASMRQLRRQQSGALRANLQDIIDESGLPEDVGNSIKDAVSNRRTQVREDARNAYELLGQAQEGVDVPILIDDFRNIEGMPDTGALRDISVTQPTQSRALTNLLAEFGLNDDPRALSRLEREGVQPEQLSIANFERFRQRLANIERADQSGNMSRIIGPIREALDTQVSAASEALELSGNPRVAELAKQARQNWQAFKTEFDPKSLTETLIADRPRSSMPAVEASQVYNRIAAPSTPIEQVDRLYQSLANEGARGRRAIGDLQSSMIMDLIDSAFKASSRKIDGERTFGGAAFARRLEQLDPKLRIVFQDNPRALERLRDVAQASEDITPPEMAVPRGSAGFFMDALQKAGLYNAMQMVPGGNFVLEGMRELNIRSGNRRALNQALDTKPELRRSARLLASEYPTLASALGIGFLVGQQENGEPNQNQ